MHLQTSHCQLIKKESLLVDEWEQLPYPLIQSEHQLLNLVWRIILDETKEELGTITLKQHEDMMTFEMIYNFNNEIPSLDLMEELLKLQIDYSFNTLKIYRLMISVPATRFDFICLLRRLGMRLEEKKIIQACTVAIYQLINPKQFPAMKMRSSSLVHSQILQFVKDEESIRILMQTGLRLDKHAPIDLMRDYHYRLYIDSTFFLDYFNHEAWMNQFGEIIIFKKIVLSDSAYLYQMQFEDGVRLDLEFISLSNLWASVYEETLCRVILDKDEMLPPLDEPNDSAHYVQCPTQEKFHQLINEIWWSEIEVAKAIYRDEVPLVESIYQEILMKNITILLSWKIGMKYQWKVDLGYKNRWLKRYLPESIYHDYIYLVQVKDNHSIWERLFFMESFVQKIAIEVSEVLNFSYNPSKSQSVMKFLHRLNSLPDNATDFN